MLGPTKQAHDWTFVADTLNVDRFNVDRFNVDRFNVDRFNVDRSRGSGQADYGTAIGARSFKMSCQRAAP